MISIVMPVYNRQDYLPETLQSIADQTYADWQLVVVDDGSTDRSIHIIQQFSNRHSGKVKFMHSGSVQSGAATCRNIGIAEADGSFIIFLDSDDKLAPFCLQQRVSVMIDNTSLDWAVFLQYLWKTERPISNVTFNKHLNDRATAIDYFFRMDPAWQTMAPVWKKDTLLKLGGFDSTLIYMEDPDLHLRALLDSSLNVVFKYDLPADCYYRIDNMDETKAERFYELSITSRFSFLDKLPELFKNIHSKLQLNNYKAQVRKGFYIFLKGFVLARVEKYKQPLNNSAEHLRSLQILNAFDIVKIRILISVFSNKSRLITNLRIKGLLYKLIN